MLNKLKFILLSALPSLLLFFFFLIPNADAASTYTIYAYGSGYIMTGILKSIASVVASGGFSLILKSVVLIGFVIIFLQMIITSFKVSPHRSLVKYFSAVLVIYSALLIPKVNVNVYDTVNNTTSNATVVSGVPWGIGAIASYFSEFQYYMTTSIEQAFSTPNSIDMTNAGMGFALTSQNMTDGIQIDDPYLFQSFTQYVYNCVLPGISTGNLSSQALTQAGMATAAGSTTYEQNDLLGYIATYTTGAGANLITTEYSSTDPTGVTTTCSVQAGDIQTSFTNYVNNDAGPQIAGALGMTYATFASQYGLVNSSIYNMSSAATSEIIQMAAVNQYDQALIASANLAGTNPSQLAYGSALAQQNMNTSFAISGQLAGQYMPVVYGIFSALFLAFSLFLIILTALPIGLNYLKMYVEMLLFLAVWPTLMAVYNYIIDLVVKNGFTSYALQGYSLNSAHTVNTYISSQLGWMGYLSWGVPMMAYALVTGSTYAMVGAISSMDSAGKSAASAGASAAASGNVNLGNDSMRNYSAANKSMDNLGAMDVSTGNIRRNNTTSNKYDTVKTHNTGTDLTQVHSAGPNGQIIDAINPKTGQTDFTKTQDGVVSTVTTPGVGSFTSQETGKDNTVDNLQTYNAGLRYNDSTDVTTGLNKTRNNKINSNFERFMKSLKGYENLNEGLNLRKFGSQSWRGNSHVIDTSTTRKAGAFYQTPDYSTNQAFLSDGSYMNNYARYSPGGAGIVSGMKAKDTGAFGTFNKNTQDMMQKYGGNINQLKFSAKAADEIEVSGGLKILGTGVQDKFKASVGVNGSTTMQTNALYTETGNQLTHYANEYKSGKISWSQYQKDTNGLVSEYKNLVNIGSAPSLANGVNQYQNLMHLKSPVTKSTSPAGKKAISELNKNSGEF